MQPADDVQLRDPELQGFARLLDNLLDAELKTVGVALLPRERAELTLESAVVRVVDVAIDDVTGAVAHAPGASQIRHRRDGIQVGALEETQRVGVGNPLAGRDFVVQVAQCAAFGEKVHQRTINQLQPANANRASL